MSDDKKEEVVAKLTMRFTTGGNLILGFKPSEQEFVKQCKAKIGSESKVFRTIRLFNEDGDLILRFPHVE